MRNKSGFQFSEKERHIFYRIGQACLPVGRIFPEFDYEIILSIEEYIQSGSRVICRVFQVLLWFVELFSYFRYLKPFSKLRADQAEKYISGWSKAFALRRLPFRLVATVLKAGYYNNPAIFQKLGVEFAKPPAKDEPAKWVQKIQAGEEIHENIELEAEIIVVGTGAGGAVVASELAEKGNAVLLIEEGDLQRRSAFTGRPLEMQRLMYRAKGFTATIGNTSMIVPVGRAVGGTTIINSGTCFRTPNLELCRWREKYGLTDFTLEHLEPYFKRVESVYQVETADMKYVGKTGEIISRGAKKLGYSHGPLPRNSPDCDGQGICCFGCPTDAKKSTNITYVPSALNSGAFMLTGTKAEKIIIKNKEVYGLEARSVSTGKKVKIKAPIVVLACGAFYTPLLLMKNKIGNSSGQLGKNLSIHPAGASVALMDEKVEGWKSIPQGYMVDEFSDEGIVLEGTMLPLDMLATVVPLIGKEFQDLMEQYNYLSMYGFMIKDTSRGRVRPGKADIPLITYFMNNHDLKSIIRGHELTARIYLEGGAKTVYSPIHRWRPITSKSDIVENLRKKVRVWDVDISAYHPLGTCFMGGNPNSYVTDPFGELYDQKNLFICDGSVVPPAIGVNPQITISALAARTADYINDRLNRN